MFSFKITVHLCLLEECAFSPAHFPLSFLSTNDHHFLLMSQSESYHFSWCSLLGRFTIFISPVFLHILTLNFSSLPASSTTEIYCISLFYTALCLFFSIALVYPFLIISFLCSTPLNQLQPYTGFSKKISPVLFFIKKLACLHSLSLT